MGTINVIKTSLSDDEESERLCRMNIASDGQNVRIERSGAAQP